MLYLAKTESIPENIKLSNPKGNHNQFAGDVLEGLNSFPKQLSSKYFYNEEGDKLFQEIMHLEEYYLTRSEFEIFSMQKDDILKIFSEGGKKFKLIEFGAGDGLKTKVLLKHFLEKEADFEYVPIDISANVLEDLSRSLEEELPELEVEPIAADYFKGLEQLNKHDDGARKVVLFLGSNIGNFSHHEATIFLQQISKAFDEDDLLFLGADLRKDPQVILDAYNDKRGVTKAFNLNLLKRINEELGANFQLEKFSHFPIYDPQSGSCKSYIVSLADQKVYIEALGKTIQFDAHETIHTEVSQKYSVKELGNIAKASGFEIDNVLYDCKHYYTDLVLKKAN
ncbi:L-histidine N(alpha)-methyltransferase [Flammeovirgaceae bacterium SG7u.111]|nr:L-histidine N(alpha)-methyltransferase [Flammeovirgaceae bacterium SG7u.132]WPO35404.1 L-histidine N(alpha)-methyltransferase [Flammeovirgaceae bacterium SG7u.111]